MEPILMPAALRHLIVLGQSAMLVTLMLLAFL